MFGGEIDGNASRRLMANVNSIVSAIRDFVIGHESRISGISDNHIHDVCNAHAAYLQALDGYLSWMATKRFHLTPETATRTEQFRDKCLELERYLQLSITPKRHVVQDHGCQQQRLFGGIGDLDESFGERNHRTEQFRDKCLELERYLQLSMTEKSHVVQDHGCQQQRLFGGIGDLDESFGERNHQSESIADRRHGGTRDFAKREKVKSREQANLIIPKSKRR
jgi:hypothetical protein